ncbi:MAG: hypothetical protein NTW66_04520 [Candidatus Magasanikbacteria bacterium]|nr:hypothetical protein [Candidatus Magasanikbacteria bacterium]
MLDKKLQSILVDFEKAQKNSVNVLAIMKMDELIDKWSIILSASWVNEKNSGDIFTSFLALMKKYFTDEELNTIARVGILPIDEHLIVGLLDIGSGAEIKDRKINGNMIYEGYVISSKKPHGN